MPALITRRQVLNAAAFGPFVIRARAADRRPNFLFLLTDDQSYGTLSITGSPFMKTPNIDRIGREGVVFTNCFVAMSLCAPSRATNLTGLYPHSHGIYINQIRWNQELPTLPRALKAAGYRTAHIGKFHMDGDDRVQPGYDYWAAQVGQGQYVNPRKNINGSWVDLKGYDTTIVTDQAIEFMRGVPRDQPFCCWIGYKACHGPFTPAPGHENDFADLEFKPPASFHSDNAGKPERVRRRTAAPARRQARKNAQKKNAAQQPQALTESAWAERERNQFRALMGAEDSVGRLLLFLDEQKLADDTIIVYAGDNGFFHGEHGLHGKLEAYEESLRVPMLARYPKAIKPRQRVDAFVSNIDLAPTLLDFCNVAQRPSMHGRSWRPLVTSKTGSIKWRERFLYEMWTSDSTPARPTVKALRTNRHKLILNLQPADVTELYDLRSDPQELTNIAAGNSDLVAQLTRQMIEEMRAVEDPAISLVEGTLKG